jgi:hypothetical protein
MRSEKLHAHARQLLPGLRRVVVAVSDDQPGGKLGDLWEHGELVGVGRSHRETGYDPRPADPYVHAEAVGGLLEQGVFAESGLSFEARAAVGAGEHARRQGHRLTKREASIVRGFGQELLPEELLGLALRRPSSAMRSSMRHKTATMKVLRSTDGSPPFVLDGFWSTIEGMEVFRDSRVLKEKPAHRIN